MKKVKIILAAIIISLVTYSIKTETNLMPYYMFFLGVMILVTGIAELQKDRKGYKGYMSIGIAFFVFLVSIQRFFMN
ncbi:DUF3953 domain-containing protein [Peribacillus sp. NPDC097675]|uniref:DUF3953 domain-containing protein n=1 Tax=Peribacillus sp. NPDC097675 TaxID=3390618 RepID=UPI003CFCDF31